MSKKKRRTVWIVSGLLSLLILACVFLFLKAGSTPFQFLHGSTLVSWKATEPSSHGRGNDYCQSIFELDEPMQGVLEKVRTELSESSGWTEVFFDEVEVTFNKKDEYIVVMPHGSNPDGTAILYVRDATKLEMLAGEVIHTVPDRYRQWQ